VDAHEAGVAASSAAEAAVVVIRPLTSLEDIDVAIQVAIETWGEYQLPPRELLRAMQESHSVLQGAFRGNVLVGFGFGWWGLDDDGWHLHSHMVAVLPGLRSSGIGYALKLAQRAACLDEGVTRVRWTFDPLQSRNAWFNISKLGASADAFHREFYGAMTDELNVGDRSDRLVVRWDLKSADDDIVDLAADTSVLVTVLGREGEGELVGPVRGDRPTAGRPARVMIPREYAALRATDPELGQTWRDASADAFDACLAAGLQVVGFTRESEYVFA